MLACACVTACRYVVPQVVRVVMDNPNNALLRSLNEGMFPPFEPYNNRQDVIR